MGISSLKQKRTDFKRLIETYVTDSEEIENINFEYENYYTKLVKLPQDKFLLKSGRPQEENFKK